MKSDITENYTKKGGLNNKPISERPSPPIGQGTQPTDKQQLKAETLRCKECERYYDGPGLKSPYCYECKWLPDYVDNFIQRKASAV